MLFVHKRILIAEDEPNMRLSLDTSLRSNGYSVTAVEDGFDALKLLKDKDSAECYDLLVTDVLMHKVNGLELLDELENRGVSIPNLVITGYNTKEVAKKLEKRNCAAVLYKPFSEELLLNKIKEILEQVEHLA